MTMKTLHSVGVGLHADAGPVPGNKVWIVHAGELYGEGTGSDGGYRMIPPSGIRESVGVQRGAIRADNPLSLAREMRLESGWVLRGERNCAAKGAGIGLRLAYTELDLI